MEMRGQEKEEVMYMISNLNMYGKALVIPIPYNIITRHTCIQKIIGWRYSSQVYNSDPRQNMSY